MAGDDFYQGAESFTGNLVFWPKPNVIFAKAKSFDGRPSEQQGQLRAAVAEADQLAVTRLGENMREARAESCAHGFPIKSASSNDLDALRQRVQSVEERPSESQALGRRAVARQNLDLDPDNAMIEDEVVKRRRATASHPIRCADYPQ